MMLFLVIQSLILMLVISFCYLKWRRLKERFFDFFNVSPFGMIILGKQREVLHCNKSLLRLLEIQEVSEIIGSPYTTLVHPEDLDLVDFQQTYGVKLRYVSKKGHFFWVRVFMFPFFFDRAVYFAIHESIQGKVDLLDKVKDQLEELQEFSYIISHDLQDPLRQISFHTELLQKKLPRTEEYQKHMQYLLSGTEKMKNTIMGILNYSKGLKIEVKKEVVFVQNILTNVQDTFAEEISTHKVKISSLQTDVQLYTSYFVIEQVFQNLFSNSLKYLDPSKNDPFIQISSSVIGDSTHFFFQDNGIGIPEEQQHQLFRPFRKINNLKQGQGLGLAICRKILDQVGGGIRLAESSSYGTTFDFWVPRKGTL